MMRSLTTYMLRLTLAAAPLLALISAAPASAASITVFWDRTDFGFGEGYGISAAEAQAAGLAGIDILTAPALPTQPDSLEVGHDLSTSSLVLPPRRSSNPATVRSEWSATNNTGINDENL